MTAKPDRINVDGMTNEQIIALANDDAAVSKLGDAETRMLLMTMASRGLPRPTTGVLADRYAAFVKAGEALVNESTHHRLLVTRLSGRPGTTEQIVADAIGALLRDMLDSGAVLPIHTVALGRNGSMFYAEYFADAAGQLSARVLADRYVNDVFIPPLSLMFVDGIGTDRRLAVIESDRDPRFLN